MIIKMKKSKMIILILFIIIGLFLLRGLIYTGIVYLLYNNSKVEVNTDISKYNDYIGENKTIK